MSVAPQVKGWCPGAFRPMMSGDGLIVRVRPFYARLEATQVLGLCDLAQRYGNGCVDLTNRANLQIRGVAPADLDPIVSALDALGLLDVSAEAEQRRNILVTPFWDAGDLTTRITGQLLKALEQMPQVPAKFGFAVDTGRAALLQDASADIRIEQSARGLIVRADGVGSGKAVDETSVMATVVSFAAWFAAHRRPDDRRMAQVLTHTDLPSDWTVTAPASPSPRPDPGSCPHGVLAGVAFGQIDAAALIRVMHSTGARALRVTPWRLLLLEGVDRIDGDHFVQHPDDPLLHADACPGAPACTSASVETRVLARALSVHATGSLHVSGCSKGCARRGRADMTFVGNQGRFDLVLKGRAWDAPEKPGLRPEDVLAEVTGQ